MPLPRDCTKCGKRFQPYGKSTRICDKCKIEIYRENGRKKRNEKEIQI